MARAVALKPACTSSAVKSDPVRARVLEGASARDWPRLELRRGVAVPGGEAVWRRFAAQATAEDLHAADAELAGGKRG